MGRGSIACFLPSTPYSLIESLWNKYSTVELTRGIAPAPGEIQGLELGSAATRFVGIIDKKVAPIARLVTKSTDGVLVPPVD